MKIVLAGCTGFIGTQLVRRLVQDGHECTVLIRTSAGAGLDALPPEVRLAPYADMPHVADAVINMAGESVVGRWTPKKKKRIIDSRVDITQYLVKWMADLQVKPTVFLSASAVGYYGDRGEDLLTEDADPDPARRFRCQVCIAWEQAANEARQLGVRVVNLRTANVLDTGGGMLAQLRLKLKFAPVILPLSRSGYFPWISMKDAVGIMGFALTHETVAGPINLVAPTPAKWIELYEAIGAMLNKKVVGEMPRWALRMAIGEFSEAVLDSQRILPEKIVHDGYAFNDVELGEYLQGLVTASSTTTPSK